MNRYARIEIRPNRLVEANAPTLCGAAHDAGLASVQTIHPVKLFFLSHRDLTDAAVETLCTTLLVDPVVEKFSWQWIDPGQNQPEISTRGLQPRHRHASAGQTSPNLQSHTIEVEFHPGVTDRVAYEIKIAAGRLGMPPLQVATGHHYHIQGNLSTDDLHQLAKQVLCNEVVQRYRLGPIEPAFIEDAESDGRVEAIRLADLNDDELLALSQERRLALNLAEMKVLRDFSRQVKRPLTDAELEMVAQTWSEHCYHKTFKAMIHYQEIDPQTQQPVKEETIDGLLQATIRAATEACSKDWVVSAFIDNAGLIEFDGENVLSFKVETHNHPSALEPFGGANTGVGGVIRDILGVSAKPIAVTDVLCFGPQDLPPDEVPAGSLHPRRVQAGVVAGVGDYGNKMGIPTVNGAVLYHPGYIANPLVYCGCVGLAPVDSHVTAPQVGDRLIVLGGRTGRDGLRGATFSSLDLDSETSEASFASTAVQIGDPIVEKDVTEVILAARDQELYHAITDCGAGGLSSAIGEMAERLGAEVELNRVGLKYSGLRPWEIWLSEAQERMVLAVPAKNLDKLASLCKKFGVEWDDVGHFTGDGQMVVRYNDQPVLDLPMSLLHEGHPRLTLEAKWVPPSIPPKGGEVNESSPLRGELEGRETSDDQPFEPNDDSTPSQPPPARGRSQNLPPLQGGPRGIESSPYDAIDPAQALLTLLANPNVASKEAIIRTYDHEVQGGTVVKPLTGRRNHGPSDAAVIKPLGAKTVQGVAVSNGINPTYGLLDPYAMALSAVDEAVRNAVAVGGDPDRLALLDNFCWGNPNLPDRLGGLVRAAKGCYDAARAFDAPFISGKDSLNNEYVAANGQRTPIPGTLLISAIAIVPDIQRVVTMDAKRAGNFIYIVGQTRRELGGSLLAQHYNLPETTPPGLPDNALASARALHRAIRSGLVQACHDLSEGGLAVAAAEMALAGCLGLTIDLDAVPVAAEMDHPLITLFSESNGRWLVEVPPENVAAFEQTLVDCTVARCGQVTIAPWLKMGLVAVEVSRLDEAWRGKT